MELDEALTAEMGFSVYVLKRQYWKDSVEVGEYVLYNGKYYTYKGVHELISEGSAEIETQISLAAMYGKKANALTFTSQPVRLLLLHTVKMLLLISKLLKDLMDLH